MYGVGRGVREEIILISGQNQKCSFFKTVDTFFWTKHFATNVKCYGEIFLKIFLTLKKNFFFRTLFGKFFRGEKFFKIFFEFCSKKSVRKKLLFECQKKFQKFFLTTFYIVWKIVWPKKYPLNCPFSKTDIALK